MGLAFHPSVRIRALLVGVLCGLAGVVVDVDHIPKYIFDILLPTIQISLGPFDVVCFGPKRPLHPLVFLISGCTFAYFGGLLIWNILMPPAKVKAKILLRQLRQMLETPIAEERTRQ